MKAFSDKQITKYFKYGFYKKFIQPALTGNGTLGGDSFAVSASTNGGVPNDGRGTAYGACFPQAGSYNTYTKGGAPTIWFTLYVPEAIIVKKLKYSALWNSNSAFNITFEASNDNDSYTVLSPRKTFGNGAQTISLENNTPFQYYRLTVSCLGGGDFDGCKLSGVELLGKKYGGYIEVSEGEDYDFTKDFSLFKLPKITNKYYAIKS